MRKTLNPVFKPSSSTFEVKIPPSIFRFGIKDHNAFQESKSLGESTWDIVTYLMEREETAEGTYPFDIWLPVELGGMNLTFRFYLKVLESCIYPGLLLSVGMLLLISKVEHRLYHPFQDPCQC